MFVFINNYKINLKPPEMYFMDTVKDKIDYSKYKENVSIAFNLLLNNLFRFIIISMDENFKDESKDIYLKTIHVICYGIYKEEK